jgi:methionine synthase II (cobalamin-independent)
VAWNCSPSCIGSLPHTEPAKAVDFILEHLSAIPFWPQLPRMGFRENMYIQYSHYLPGVEVDEQKKKVRVDLGNYDPEEFYTRVLSDDVDSFFYPHDSFHGLYEFLGREMPPTVKAVKGQIIGPVSLGLQTTDNNDKPVIYDEAYSEIIRKNLNLMARWQERELRKKCPQTIMFVDEPYLSIIGTPFASVSSTAVVSWINEVLEGVQGRKGIHCCANTDWPFVMSMNIDILSFDAYDYGYTISLYPDEVEGFLRRGGSIAWGMIPNTEEALKKESVPSLVKNAEKLFRSLEDKGLDLDLILKNSIITPQCGLSGVEEAVSDRVLSTLAAVSKDIRTKHSLE